MKNSASGTDPGAPGSPNAPSPPVTHLSRERSGSGLPSLADYQGSLGRFKKKKTFSLWEISNMQRVERTMNPEYVLITGSIIWPALFQ